MQNLCKAEKKSIQRNIIKLRLSNKKKYIDVTSMNNDSSYYYNTDVL